MRQQHLDANNIALGMLNMIRPHPGSFQNFHLNTVQLPGDEPLADRRMELNQNRGSKSSILVPHEDAEASAREIERCAGDNRFAQAPPVRAAPPNPSARSTTLSSRSTKRPPPPPFLVGVHAFGFGGFPVTGSGWPSFYLEDMVGHAQSEASRC